MKFEIIYADPSWQYKDKANAGKRGVEHKYKTMNIEDIKNLKVNEISSENSVLFIWVTFPFLKEGLEVIESWGFKYKTIAFNWVKTNKKDFSKFQNLTKKILGEKLYNIFFQTLYEKLSEMNLNIISLFWGMGNWTRSNSEVCLMGIKGNPKRMEKGVHSVLLDPINREHHSRKPDEARKRIVKLMGDLKRVELFATIKSDGWNCVGNEIGADIEDFIKTNIEENYCENKKIT